MVGGNNENKNKHNTQEGSHSLSHPLLIEKFPLNEHFNYNQTEWEPSGESQCLESQCLTFEVGNKNMRTKCY